MTQGLCESESPSCWGNRVGEAPNPGEGSLRRALREKELGLKAMGKGPAGRGSACANAQGYE